jgi:small subunit ribosomal protein S26e
MRLERRPLGGGAPACLARTPAAGTAVSEIRRERGGGGLAVGYTFHQPLNQPLTQCSVFSFVLQDKAVKRYVVRNMVDAASFRDISEASAIEGYALPKLYHKMYFSISAAIHSHYVRVRSRTNRRKRAPPQRFAPRREDKPAAAGTAAK